MNWHVEIYDSGTLRLKGRSDLCGENAAFKTARSMSGGLIRVVERKKGVWVYYHKSGRRAGEWECPHK